MAHGTLKKAATGLVVVALLGGAAVVGARLLEPALDIGTGAAQTGPPGSSPAAPPAAGCFDPSAPAEPVMLTNPRGPVPDRGGNLAFIPAARSLPTFGGIWVNEFRRELHVAVSCDVDGAVAALGPLAPRNQTVIFHLVQYTYAELEAISDRIFADRDLLASEGIFLSMSGIDERGNRVRIGIDPLNEEIIAVIGSRYGQPITFEHLPRAEPIPDQWPTEPEVLVAARSKPQSERMVTCDSPPFPAALLDEADVADVPDDLAEPLAAAVQFWHTAFDGLEGRAWRLVHRGADVAHFIARDEDGWLHIDLRRAVGGWEPAGVGECTPVAALAGASSASWSLDGAYPAPGPDASELHVLVHERACSGGTPAFGRIDAPVVEYGADTLMMTIGVQPRGGIQTCPGNPPTPATVILPEPLGGRDLLDGGREPPAPPVPDF